MTSHLKLKSEISGTAIYPLKMFIQDWIEDICGNNYYIDIEQFQKKSGTVITVRFNHSEDALAIKLKGIPNYLSKYIELSY